MVFNAARENRLVEICLTQSHFFGSRCPKSPYRRANALLTYSILENFYE